MIDIVIDLKNKINKSFFPLLNNKNRFLIAYGGAGSGKSVFVPQKLILRILNEKNHKFLAVRKVGSTIKNSVFAEIENCIKDFGISSLVTINKSERTFYFPTLNSTIICIGLDDPEKIKSISRPTGIWCEEATEFSEDEITQLNLRMRGATESYFQLILTFNPISALHWIKKKFFDVNDKNVTILKTTYKDNQFLDEQYIEQLLDMKDKDETFFQIYTEGEWGILGNVIFSNFIIDEVPYNEEDYDEIDCGLDFGFNHPSAYVRVGWKDGQPYIFKEFSKRQLTNNQLIDEIELIHDKSKKIVADSAEPDRIKEFQQRGFRIEPAIKGKGSVKDAIDFLKRHRLHISPDCINLINEISMYRYKEDRSGLVHEEPVAINDDVIAALRYATEHRWRKRNKHAEVLR